MTIGRNPGLEHDYSNIDQTRLKDLYHERWLISRYGKYLQKIFGTQFVKDNIFACNICKCSSPKNTTLMDAEIIACLGYLWDQIDIIEPMVILVFGAEAAKSMPGLKYSSYLQPTKYKEHITFVCRHPAYFLYKHDEVSKAQEEEQAKVLRTIKEFVNSKTQLGL